MRQSRFIACGLVLTCLIASYRASAGEALPSGLSNPNGGGFAEQGKELVIAASQREGRIVTSDPLLPGFYTLLAEYRTDGFDAGGGFSTDVKTIDRSTNLSPYEVTSAQAQWSPLAVYFKVEQESSIQIRLGAWQKAGEGAKVYLRNLKLVPYSFKDQASGNWLVGANWDSGQEGFLPPGWFWKGNFGTIDQISLVKNTSYRSGNYILRLTGDEAKTRMAQARYMPMPPNGEITFTVWARSSDQGKLKMHVVSDAWTFRVEKAYEPTETWKQYSATLVIPPNNGKNWFFLRLDKDEPKSTVEIADPQVTWKPSGPVTEEAKVDALQDAYNRGWQGTPGRNLIYNPDLELGGTGYFYDFSWPKTYENYQTVHDAKPVQLLAGKGVDGGTCALVQGASLRAYCFPVTVGQTYTVSADLRAPEGQAEAECQVMVTDSEWSTAMAAKASKIPGNQWKRVSWTFNWSKANIQKRGYVRFDSKGILIDHIQVAKGKVAEYDAPPVMLGLMTDRAQYFVRGRDTARATLKIVPGKLQDGTATVEVVAKDAWGREAWKKTLAAPLNKTTELPMDLPADKLGTFHVNLTAKIGSEIAGIGISRYAIIEKPVLQPTSPGHPGLAGICQESFNFPVWLCEDHAKIQTDLGIRLNRFFASVPPNLPYPIPAEFSADLLAKCKPFRETGIDLMPCIDIIPDETSKASANLEMPKPEDLEKYGKHLGMYVKALAPEVRYWEIFNEPNLWRVNRGPNQGKRTMYPAKYFEFQKVAYNTIKSVDPNMLVVCNAINNLQWDWIADWMKLGAGNYMDAFSFHPYGVTDFTAEGARLEKTMADFGFGKPVINSEKYYGANLFYDRAGYEETRRGYYLPYNKEVQIAGWSIEHFVSSAATRVPVCFFNPGGTLFTRGPGQELFVYDFFAAYNAATRFMVNAGRGEAVAMGPSVKAIIFPSAQEGPLLVVWTENPDVDARIKLPGEYTAYDIMGNPYTTEQRQEGLRLAADPTYIRYKSGMTAAAIKASLSQADILGLGAPVLADMSITGARQISAYVTSARPKALSGQVRLLSLPQDWKASPMMKAFTDLPGGKTTRVEFALESGQIENMADYPVSFIVESGEEFLRKEAILRPLFVQYRENIGKADGNLAKWDQAQWIKLGDGQVSAKFNANLARTGDKDLSAKLALAWSPTHLAIVVVATDDVHHPAEAPALGWQGDSLQLFLNAQPNAGGAPHHDSTDIRYIISRIGDKSYAWLDKGAEGNFKGAANKTDGFNDGDVDVAVRREGDTTIYEIILPRDKCLPGTQFGKDGSLGFSLLLNDNDGQGRKAGLTVSPKGTEPYGHSREYRSLIFLER